MLRRTLLPFARLSSSVLNSIKLAKDGKRAGDDEDGGRDAFHTSIQPCGCLGPATLNPHWTMNVVKEIERINARELELGGNSSWHDDYKDSAYIFVGGLDYELTEGDVITIFSQYGEIADVNLPRDKKTGRPRGFAFVMYEDQRSTVLAVDNLSGASVVGRTLRVDHVNKYKQLEKNEEGKFIEREEQSLNALPENFTKEDDSDSDASSHPSIDPEDPMAAYMLEQSRAAKKRKKSSKHAGETKEERKARKQEKKRLKALKSEEKKDGSSRSRRRSVSKDREEARGGSSRRDRTAESDAEEDHHQRRRRREGAEESRRSRYDDEREDHYRRRERSRSREDRRWR